MKKIMPTNFFFLIIVFILLTCEIFYPKRSFQKNNNYFNKSLLNNTNKFFINDYINNYQNKTMILLNGKKYIDKCLKKQNYTEANNINKTPVISTIIPVYNCNKTIYSAICSIQNQNYTDFEIILIDDYSNDNSLKIIQNFQVKDKRIKVLKNKKNMGTLYSRSLGVLMSKGEYIFPLDNDDFFFSCDIFSSILRIAQEYKFDIVGFRAISINDYENIDIEKMKDLYDYQFYPNSTIINQPQLSTWMIIFNGQYQLHDVTIWCKCIKSKIYKEATIKLGKRRFSIFVSWGEDAIINFIIFNISQSFIFIHKYGIIHLDNPSTASYSISDDIKLFGEIYFVDILYDFLKNNDDKNYAVMGA